MLRIGVIVVAVSILLFTATYCANGSIYNESVVSDNIPRPRVIAPDSDIIDLSGKKELVFKWSPHEGDVYQRKYYDFRLYEGLQTLGPNLMLKKRVGKNKHQFSVDAGLFKAGAEYTWSIRQKYRSGKSLRTTNSFKVIKK